jgi:hypothetical protein
MTVNGIQTRIISITNITRIDGTNRRTTLST